MRVLLHSGVVTALKSMVTGVLVRIPQTLTAMTIARRIASLGRGTNRVAHHLLLRQHHSGKQKWNGQYSACGC
jgi:hypothetical protein